MPRYFVSGVMTISVHVYVDAETPEEAKKVAEDAPLQGFCHQCARGQDDEWSTSGELDGTPQDLEVREAYSDDEVEM